MKRSLAAAVFAVALIWPANVAAAAPSWDLTGEYTIPIDCTAGCTATKYCTGYRSRAATASPGPWLAVVSGLHPDHTITGTVSGSNVTLEFIWSEAAVPT